MYRARLLLQLVQSTSEVDDFCFEVDGISKLFGADDGFELIYK